MIDIDVVLAQLTEAAGQPPPPQEPWREGLEVLVDSCNTEAHLHEIGEIALTDQMVRPLAVRSRVLDWHERHPEVGALPVDRPVFIIGLPRTGTTLLSYLLDVDPANRSLLRWESFDPVPPPTPEERRSGPRVDVAQAQMDALYEVSPEFAGIHYETGAGPTECVVVLAGELTSVHYETMAYVPSYGAWMQRQDFRPAYEHHRRVLQVLASGSPGRWVLKSPCHLLSLDALDAVYPDAVFVATHRDPARVVASLANLVHVLSGISSDHDARVGIGRRWFDLVGTMIENQLAFRDALLARGEGHRWIDLDYASLVAEPIGAAGGLYDRLGWTLTADAEAAMARYVADNPKGRHGAHAYAAADFGLDPTELTERFARYREALEVPPEPAR